MGGQASSRASRGFVAAGLALCAVLGAGGCVSDSYAGGSLRPGRTPAEVQALAERARSGDKGAQLELGKRYEAEDGIPRDSSRARNLYAAAAAAADNGGTRTIFMPQRNGSVSAIPVNMGVQVSGLPEAKIEFLRLAGSAPHPSLSSSTATSLSPDLESRGATSTAGRHLSSISSGSYQVAAADTGGTKTTSLPQRNGFVSPMLVNSGKPISGSTEVRRPLTSISLAGFTKRPAIPRSDTLLPEELDVIQKLRAIAKNSDVSDFQYDGKFMSWIAVKAPVASESFNSSTGSGDSRTPYGICGKIESLLREVVFGETIYCDSYTWNAVSYEDQGNVYDSVIYQTIDYRFSGIPIVCDTLDFCSRSPFSSSYAGTPRCSYVTYHQFHDKSGKMYRLLFDFRKKLNSANIGDLYVARDNMPSRVREFCRLHITSNMDS